MAWTAPLALLVRVVRRVKVHTRLRGARPARRYLADNPADSLFEGAARARRRPQVIVCSAARRCRPVSPASGHPLRVRARPIETGARDGLAARRRCTGPAGPRRDLRAPRGSHHFPSRIRRWAIDEQGLRPIPRDGRSRRRASDPHRGAATELRRRRRVSRPCVSTVSSRSKRSPEGPALLPRSDPHGGLTACRCARRALSGRALRRTGPGPDDRGPASSARAPSLACCSAWRPSRGFG